MAAINLSADPIIHFVAVEGLTAISSFFLGEHGTDYPIPS